ncbi:tryptophan 7-halogenase [Shewanella sairae]|uniref:tryptophan halogenase family protein n=1 Tax=Shewanella sairae TaxID=190310 RepID=UPI00200C481B|nr:tryptophan halogenase family protein [Shewanella sairae]MCL1128665.1 tryptophan 7-halogenase [Shewanella sairae]
MEQVKTVHIIGGGTSGWLSAAVLASSFKRTGRDIVVTLIESENIPTIGVGEGTFPTILSTLNDIGISEKEFLNHCQASFKQGAMFKNWLYNPSEQEHSYYHPFDPPAMPKGIDLSSYWVAKEQKGQNQLDFAHSVSVQAKLCDENLAPKSADTPEYAWMAKYAYHLDAAELGKLLKKHAMEKLGVQHLYADIDQVKLDDEGYIESVVSKSGTSYAADFFVDCTGFSSLLLGQSLNVPFVSKADYLTVDSAVVLQVPHATEESDITTHTVSTAQESGWIWDIALQSRRGTGYVYSSKHSTKDRAEEILKQYHGIADSEALELRHIKFNVGYRAQSWTKNCCAIGFSSGFVEPLEATAIAMVEAGAKSLAARFPSTRAAMDERQKQYNEIFISRWDNIIDFVKLHYCLSQRKDTKFWQEHTDEKTIPQSLIEKLKAWKLYGASDGDFPNKYDLFNIASWQYIIYGMKYIPEYIEKSPIPDNIVDAAFNSIQALGENAKVKLDSNRQLIQKYR